MNGASSTHCVLGNAHEALTKIDRPPWPSSIEMPPSWTFSENGTGVLPSPEDRRRHFYLSRNKTPLQNKHC
ncbi:unnamed protein product [Lasius platythorax]|uniref:Uncharacterized protein n=1 Tax=Lasius platythorax TaxID=488582 RepID=A0AAV2N148_9HYME